MHIKRPCLCLLGAMVQSFLLNSPKNPWTPSALDFAFWHRGFFVRVTYAEMPQHPVPTGNYRWWFMASYPVPTKKKNNKKIIDRSVQLFPPISAPFGQLKTSIAESPLPLFCPFAFYANKRAQWSGVKRNGIFIPVTRRAKGILDLSKGMLRFNVHLFIEKKLNKFWYWCHTLQIAM